MIKDELLVLDSILNKPSTKIDVIKNETKLTTKRILNLAENINDQLCGSGLIIKYGDALKIKIVDTDKFNDFYTKLVAYCSDNELNSRLLNESLFLLNAADYIKIEDLADIFYVSTRQISTDLKWIRTFFDKYSLAIISKPYYGLIVEGDELNKRICIAYIYSRNKDINNIILQIRNIVSDVINENNYSISDFAYENLIVHLYVSIVRIKNKQSIKFKNDEPIDVNSKAYELAHKIAGGLKNIYKIDFNKDEIDYIYIHIKSKRKYSDEHYSEISSEINGLVHDFLSLIDKTYQTDFKNDFQLCIALALHFTPLISRVIYGLRQDNPMLDQIKQKYMFEFQCAETGSLVINDRYNTILSEEEIGYIALDLRLSIEKRNKGKYDILLVCSSGRGSSELLKEKFTSHFNKYIKRISAVSLNDINVDELENHDYIFTTVPLLIKTRTPIFKISYFLDDDELNEINNYLLNKELSINEINTYFPKKLFLGKIDCKNKDDAIKKMVENISIYEDIPSDFLEQVILREKEAITSFGNNVAFPHPKNLITSKTFASVAILNEPLLWGDKKVSLIFLASIEKKSNKNIQIFYKMISKIINNKKYIDKLINNPEYKTLENILLE